MYEDLTQKLPLSNGETLKQILEGVYDLRLQLGETNLRLGTLDQKVDERLHDTRPIGERLTTDIAQLKQGQEQLQKKQEQLERNQEQLQQNQQQFQGSLFQLQENVAFLRNESRDVRNLLRDIFRRMSIFNDTLVTMQADYRDIYDRVRGLEPGGTS